MQKRTAAILGILIVLFSFAGSAFAQTTITSQPEDVSVSAIVTGVIITPPPTGGGGGGFPICVVNPQLCTPPAQTCETNPQLCVTPPEFCTLHPGLCMTPPDFCTQHPDLCIAPPDPGTCEKNPHLCDPFPQPDPCTKNPILCKPPVNTCTNDPSLCVPPKDFCERHPDRCVPYNPDTPPIITAIKKSLPDDLKNLASGMPGRIATAVGLVAAVITSIASDLLFNPFSFYDLWLLLARAWSLILTFFGIKKKSKPWGVVYDSITKQPIDPAYVTLRDMQGNEVASAITDMEGRYGFAVPKGMYTIVAKKTNYEFPSKKLKGVSEDELYRDLYYGGVVAVAEDGGIIAKNIPMDQLDFDWNEYAKNTQKRLKTFKRRDVVLSRVSNILFIFGFIVTGIAVIVSHTAVNIVLIGVYAVTAVLRIVGFHAKPKGTVFHKASNQAVPFSIVRIFSTITGREVLHKVADAQGTYYILLPNGTYGVVVETKNTDERYTKHEVRDPVHVQKGYMKEDFKI